MITPKPQLNLKNAKEYFRAHLCAGGYYTENKRVIGQWFGQGAELMGLKGNVSETEFVRLCDSSHPITGEKLTPRLNTHRISESGSKVANRRIFYDFAISPPKSVSVVALLQDSRILEVHERAAKQAIQELEKFAETRVRKSRERGSRRTGNVVAALFTHDLSRDLDPHLHTHCIVLNATFDSVEKRWKAIEVERMYRARSFLENVYYHELSKGLRLLGYEIENNRRAFEIKGVPLSVIERFSKRRQEIDEVAKQWVSTHGGDINAVREVAQMVTRKRKVEGVSADALRSSWWQELSSKEQNALASVRSEAVASARAADIFAAVKWAEEYLFERRSVVYDYELLSAALARGRGESFELEALREAVNKRGFIRQQGTDKLTTRELLRCELEIVLAARDGRNRHGPLNWRHVCSPALEPDQKTAVEKILRSGDFITLFRGGAGTGKSFTLKEVERGLDAANRAVVVVAPQRQQVRDLQLAGLPAETLSMFLQKQEIERGAVVIVDEAGQIGGRQLRQLIALVEANEGRIILSGDTRQHGAVPASDALRAIEKHSRLTPVTLEKIRRQDPKLGKTAKERGTIRSYRAAVKAASKGDIAKSFERLEKMGCIHEVEPELRRDVVAMEYVKAIGRGEKTLVVAQTRDEVSEINEAIREKLCSVGKLEKGQSLLVYRPCDLTEAEKRDARFYAPGQRAFFLRSYGRFKKGDLCTIESVNEHGLVLIKDGHSSAMSYRYIDRVSLAREDTMELAVKDQLQIKFNGKSVEGARISNGELVTVHAIRRSGAIVVKDAEGLRKTLAPSQRLFVRGYAVTSYASQGKTVDTVILADSGNRAATSCEQWYVSISRGKKRALVVTSDQEALRVNVQRSSKRELALEINKVRAGEKAVVQSRAHKAAVSEDDSLARTQHVLRYHFVNETRSNIASNITITQ